MPSDRWNIYFLNVGDGDCILIVDSHCQHSVLIDAGLRDPRQTGRYSYRLRAAEFLASLGVHEIDVLISTHFHEDHAGGLSEVLDSAKIGQFWCNYYPPSYFWDISCATGSGWRREAIMMADAVRDFQTTLRIIQREKIPVSVIGDGFSQQLWEDVLVTGLHPGEPERSEYDQIISSLREEPAEANFCRAMKTLNGISLMLSFKILETRILLPSDPGIKYIKPERLSPSNLLKLAHHGGDDGSDAELLKRISPQHIVITASKNSPEFPGEGTVSLLADLRRDGRSFKLHPVDSGDRPYLQFAITKNGCEFVP